MSPSPRYRRSGEGIRPRPFGRRIGDRKIQPPLQATVMTERRGAVTRT